MEAVLQQLVNLQYIDSRIDEITQLRGDLPEEISDVETDILRHRALVTKLEEELASLAEEEARLRSGTSDSIAKVTKYEEQQLTVRNNREYDALTKEIEAQRQFVKDAERRIEEIITRREDAGTHLDRERELLESIEGRLGEMKENLEVVIDKTSKEEELLHIKRKELVGKVEPRMLQKYEKLRTGLANHVAVVAMKDGAAFGMALPPQAQVEVKMRNKIVVDEHSGRIVVDPSFFDKAKETITI